MPVESTLKKRNARMSLEQKLLLLDFAEKNPDILRTTVNARFTGEHRRKLWEKVTTLLNACGNGGVKSSREWMKSWNDWKSTTRVKWQGMKKDRTKPNIESMATENRRLLILIGTVKADGTSTKKSSKKSEIPETPTTPTNSNLEIESREEIIIADDPNDSKSSISPESPPVVISAILNSAPSSTCLQQFMPDLVSPTVSQHQLKREITAERETELQCLLQDRPLQCLSELQREQIDATKELAKAMQFQTQEMSKAFGAFTQAINRQTDEIVRINRTISHCFAGEKDF